MMNYNLLLINIAIFTLIFFIVIIIYMTYKNKIKYDLDLLKQNYSNKISSLQTYCDKLEKDNLNLKQEIKDKDNQINNKNIEISELKTNFKNEKISIQEQMKLLEEAKHKLTIQFQEISNKIFEEKSAKFTEQNKNNLNSILEPIQNKIDNFKKLVQQTYDKDNENRGYLKKELQDLKDLNYKLSDSANSLTNALTKQNKTQGDWGEMILETILEQSGLKKDVQYYFQKTLKDENNKLFRPDIIIRLPENKNIIIDSKVSLIHFKDYSNATDKNIAKDYLNKHISSVEAHIKELAKKDYSELLSDGQNLDVVLMFMPIESAYLSFINEKNNLINEYFSKKNIIPVGPSNLILTLKIIYNIWRYEYQNQNTKKIAKVGGELYDKFVSFTDNLLSIGDSLQKAQDLHKKALNQLKEGKGNAIKKAQELKHLGIKTKKDFNDKLLNKDEQEQEYEGQNLPKLKDSLENHDIIKISDNM